MKSYNTILNENLEWAKETFAKIDKKGSAVVIKWDQEVGVFRYKNERLESDGDGNGACRT